MRWTSCQSLDVNLWVVAHEEVGQAQKVHLVSGADSGLALLTSNNAWILTACSSSVAWIFPCFTNSFEAFNWTSSCADLIALGP